jgi:RNA polymerase sigma factor (sigma-70 family)
MNEDNELLRRFGEERSERAFAELVQRKINLVYAAALRQVGDAHLASDVTQAVFLSLACRARTLTRHPALTAWLYTTTRFIAMKTMRAHHRWQRREQEAHSMNALHADTKLPWEDLHGVIDDALHELNESDRSIILLRFFEDRSFAELGQQIGTAENAARMRVDRALEKLRGRLAKRGITSTAVALGVALANQPVVAAPAGLATSIVGPSVIGATAAGSGALTFFGFMTTAKIITGAICLSVLAGLGGYALHTPPSDAASESVINRSSTTELQAKLTSLTAENERLRRQLQTAESGTADVKVARHAPELSAMDRLHVLADAQKSGILTTRVPFVTPDGKFSPKFIELFALTPEQTASMQRAYDKAKERIGELTAANATTHTTPDGKLVIDVKPFEGGAQVYDDAMDAFAAILGPERNGPFMQLVGPQVGDDFSQFGAEERTLTLGRAADKDGIPMYSLSDQRRIPNATNSTTSGLSPGVPATSGGNAPAVRSSGRVTTSTQSVPRAGIEKRLGPLMKLVPPNM